MSSKAVVNLKETHYIFSFLCDIDIRAAHYSYQFSDVLFRSVKVAISHPNTKC